MTGFFVTVVLLLLSPCAGLLAQDSVPLQVRALNSETGALSLYILEFTARDTLQPDAAFEIDFPEGFDLSKTSIADSDAMNGAFDVAVSGRSVNIVRKGKGARVAPGGVLDLKFALVGNPPTPQERPISLRVRQTAGDATPQLLNGTITTTQSQ
jgi:hypothetical protein